MLTSRTPDARSGPQCAALTASSEGSKTRPLGITFATPGIGIDRLRRILSE